MNVVHRTTGWWIEGVPPYELEGALFSDCGPYHTKAEALSDLSGLRRFIRDHPEFKEDWNGGAVRTRRARGAQ